MPVQLHESTEVHTLTVFTDWTSAQVKGGWMSAEN